MPEAQFPGRAAVEELLGDVDAVAAFRRRGQSEELLRLQAVQQPAVGGRHGVGEFIDHHDVEEVRCQLFNAEGGQRLDGGEYVLSLPGFVFPDVEFAVSAVLHDVSVGVHGLF